LGEIFVWIISIVVHFNGTGDYPLVWLHLVHVIRGLLGIVISSKLPKSYELVEQIDVNDPVMENKIFNDVIRDTVKQNILPRLQDLKGYLLAYFALTFCNFMIDIVDFLYIISNLTSSSSRQLDTIVFLVLVFVYLVIDLSYVFWTNSLKYSYSPDMLSPINEAFSGVVQKLKNRFKLGRKRPEEEAKEIDYVVDYNSEKKNDHGERTNSKPNHIVDNNQVDLQFKQSGGKAGKEYDEVDIDFEQNNENNNNNNYVVNNNYNNGKI
jgi:hypothetical protein